MTDDEKITKLGELMQQVQSLLDTIKYSGIDEHLTRHALAGLADADLELRAACVLVRKRQKQAQKD